MLGIGIIGQILSKFETDIQIYSILLSEQYDNLANKLEFKHKFWHFLTGMYFIKGKKD